MRNLFFLERISYTMDVKEILRHVDHTLLAPTATWEEIRQICDDGIKYGCASVCIPQTYVAHAAHYIAEQQHYGDRRNLFFRHAVSRFTCGTCRLPRY